MFAAVRTIDPEGVERRKNDLQRNRGEYIVPGPNYIWSMDRYDKFRAYGIEIYAAIDAYSRYIIWIYVGVTNRTAISVLSQYLDIVKQENIMPRIIRTDRGGETVLCADAHAQLVQKNTPDVAFEDCFYYGTSTSNQRIEAWWGQMTKS